jgi:subtilase family serine protease
MRKIVKMVGWPKAARSCIVESRDKQFVMLLLSACVGQWILFASEALAQKTTVEISPLVARSTWLAHTDTSKEIGVVLALPSADPSGLAAFVGHVSTPGDPLYHQYITPQEFAQRFGGKMADYQALKDWATGNGLRISQESVSRINLSVRGSVAKFESLFKTTINTYRSPDGKEFYSAGVKPAVPSEIAAKISGVIGLTESKKYAPLVKVANTLGENPDSSTGGVMATQSIGTGPGGSYSAADLKRVYSVPDFGNLGKNIVMALFEQGGFVRSDIRKYLIRNNLPNVPITPVSVDQSPTTVYDAGVELSAVLDIDIVIGINPSLKEVLVYEDSIDSFGVAVIDAETQVADENRAQVLSISYGEDESLVGSDTQNAENSALAQLAAEGISVLAASGNDGAYGNGYYSLNVADPASQPYVTAVGGTTLITGNGGVYGYETAWNNMQVGGGATGGGVSSYWAIPTWQSTEGGITGYCTYNGGSETYRNVPDVAAVGDPYTGVGVYSKMNGGWIQVGGTNLSCPIWASYLSVIDAGFAYAQMGTLGTFNPTLWGVGTFDFGYGYVANWLYNITMGSNGYAGHNVPGYTNGPGYSNTTGNGSLWGGGLAPKLFCSGSAPGKPPAGIRTFTVTTGSTTALFKWSASSGATAYVLEIILSDPSQYWTQAQSFITKDRSLKVNGLVPHNSNYSASVFGINKSGFSQGYLPIFSTN